MAARTQVFDKKIDLLSLHPDVVDGMNDAAGAILDDVERWVSTSSTLKPMADRFVRQLTERGILVGTSWGPATPVEFGTAATPGQRVWLGAAESTGLRLELG